MRFMNFSKYNTAGSLLLISDGSERILTMGKITYQNEFGNEVTKFTKMFNKYGVGEELLFPIEMNESGNLRTNLATYLIRFHEFHETQVEIKVENNKDGIRIF